MGKIGIDLKSQVFTKQQNLSYTQIESICRQQFRCGQNDEICSWQSGKRFGKGLKY